MPCALMSSLDSLNDLYPFYASLAFSLTEKHWNITKNFCVSLQKRARPRRCFLLYLQHGSPLTRDGGQSFLADLTKDSPQSVD